MVHKLIALLLILGITFPAMAETFVVTSTADSGPGTLREAITKAAANGTSSEDLITFAIADLTEAGRTIRLQSELPTLSSRLTIDGSTQPGAVLGISTAKVTLYLDHYTALPFTFLFIINATEVNIFGLCFKYFDNPDAGSGLHYAIGLRNSGRITVGAPGKGNLFSSVRAGITNNYWNYYSDAIRALTVQSNVFGLDSRTWTARRGFIDLLGAEEITVGGPTAAEGNVFVGASVRLTQAANSTAPFFARIQNNRFNLDWTGQKYFSFEGGNITLWGNVTDDTTTIKTWILDNVNSGSWPSGIGLNQLYHKAVVQGNKLSTDITGTRCMGSDNDLGIYACKSVVVGGYTPQEENTIAGAIYTQNRGVHIIKNKLGWISTNGRPLAAGDPFVTILTYDGGLLTGKANPGAKIQLYTNTCDGCISRQYHTTVYADAAGDWQYAYPSTVANLVATATTADSSTSQFTEVKVDRNKAVINHPTCGKSNGSISGIVIKEGTHIRWKNGSTGAVISTDTNLVNVPEGSYVLLVSNGEKGCAWNANFSLYDQKLPATLSVQTQNAACGNANGSIITSAPQNLSFRWNNAKGDSIGTGYYLNRLPPGSYTLKAWIPSDTTCSKTYGPYEVLNSSGPSLNTGGLVVSPAACGRATGSIRGITAVNTTGSPFYLWVDSAHQRVGNTPDLLNVPPGKYRLKFKDGGSCDTLVSVFFTVPNEGHIVIDSSGKQISDATCTAPSGSIRGFKVQGATSYEWVRTTDGAVVGTELEVGGLPAGTYHLRVFNDFGCSATSSEQVVPQARFLPISVVGAGGQAANCGKANGRLVIHSFSGNPDPYGFRWVDSATNAVVGRTTLLQNVESGTYFLWATDANGCEQQIYTGRVARLPVPYFDYSRMQVKDDQCQSGQGSIQGVEVRDGRGSLSYSWWNEAGDSLSASLQVQNLQQGVYSLRATDAIGCTITSHPVPVGNTNPQLPPPQYAGQVILKNTAATLTVLNPSVGQYQLFETESAAAPVQTGPSGIFTTPVLSEDHTYYVRLVQGVCSTGLVPVGVKVVDKIAVYVPSAFSPNGDGKNDVLKAVAFGPIRLHYFTVYNRWGETVFSTSDFSRGWNGTVQNKLLESGVFAWILKATDERSGAILQQKGTVILLR